MTRKPLSRTILLACILAACAGFARADIVQCVDESGTVSYTDVPCQNDADVTRAPVLSKPTAVRIPLRIPLPSVSGRFATAEKARKAASAKKHASKRRLAIDVETLKGAKSSALLTDQASFLLRQQKLAALEQDQKGRRWFDF